MLRNNKLLWDTGLCFDIIVFNSIILLETVIRPYLSGILVFLGEDIFVAVAVPPMGLSHVA